MKKLVFILSLTISFLCMAQTPRYNDSGTIEYEILINGAQSIDTVSDKKTKFMLEKMKSIFDSKTFILEFNRTESIFKASRSMEDQNSMDDVIIKVANILSNQTKVYYRNNKDRLKLRTVEISGDRFLVESSLKDDNHWVLTKDSKVIKGYKCYRAYKVVTQESSLTKEKRTFVHEVWFASDLNFPFGPAGLDGLPGLVLEGSKNGKFVYTVKTIKFDLISLDISDLKGKRISETDFEKLMFN